MPIIYQSTLRIARHLGHHPGRRWVALSLAACACLALASHGGVIARAGEKQRQDTGKEPDDLVKNADRPKEETKQVRVVIQTEKGDIEVELDAAKAPAT